MKKNTIRWFIVLAVILIVYNVAVFAIPFEKTTVFFLSWIFTLAAIGVQIYVVHSAFGQGKSAKSKFYGFPIAKIGAAYLAIQIILGLIFMASGSHVPVWAPLVLYVALLGASAIGFIAADSMRDEIERQDAKLQKDVACMRGLQSKAASMIQLAQDGQVRAALEKFSENLRFSDPVSSEELKDIESDLAACVDELERAVVDGDYQAALALEREAGTVLAERNRLCKLGKQAR